MDEAVQIGEAMMKREIRAMLTMVPTVFSSALLAMMGWLPPVPNPKMLRWTGGLAAVFVIWLWTDWLFRERKP